MAWNLGQVSKMPRLTCIGRVEDMTAPKLGPSGAYYNMRVTIKGISGASKNITTNFLFRPEWFNPDFDPAQFDQMVIDNHTPEESARIVKMFKRNYDALLGAKGSNRTGQLPALCGSEEAFNELDAVRNAAYAKRSTSSGFTAEEVGEFIKGFVMGQGATFLYTLRQQTEKTDEVGEDGKQVYIRTENYEVDRWDYNTEKTRTSAVKSVARTNDPAVAQIAFQVD